VLVEEVEEELVSTLILGLNAVVGKISAAWS
jgi:hypothetical protein